MGFFQHIVFRALLEEIESRDKFTLTQKRGFVLSVALCLCQSVIQDKFDVESFYYSSHHLLISFGVSFHIFSTYMYIWRARGRCKALCNRMSCGVRTATVTTW